MTQYLGKIGVKFVQINVNMYQAYPLYYQWHYLSPAYTTPQPRTTTTTATIMPETEESEDDSDNFGGYGRGGVQFASPVETMEAYSNEETHELKVIAFQPGSLITSAEEVLLKENENTFVTLQPQFIDRSDAEEAFNCSNDPNFHEDDCLMR